MKPSEADIEQICASLGIGTQELLDFVFEKRRAKIAMELDQRFETKSIDELTAILNSVSALLEGNKNGKGSRRKADKI